LIVEPDEHAEVAADPVASKYLRPFVGARQLIHDEPRWCLWLVDVDPADIARSTILKTRLEHVRLLRAASPAASTPQMADPPHPFGQSSQPATPYVCVPRHPADARAFTPTALYGPEVICGDSNFKADDPDGFAFAAIESPRVS